MKTSVSILMLATCFSAYAQSNPAQQPKPSVPVVRPTNSTVNPTGLANKPAGGGVEAKPVRSNLVSTILNGTNRQARDGGTAIGGGTVYEGLLSWCNQATGILQDTLIAAREVWGRTGDASESLNLYVDGLRQAQQSSTGVQTVAQTFTLRFVQRGLSLSQILGADYIIAGQVLQDNSTKDLVSFFDWYVSNTRQMGEQLDAALNIPYVSARNCRGSQCRQIPAISTASLEDKVVKTTIDSLRNLQVRFAKQLPDRSNYYTTIGITNYLRAQSFMLGEIADDLRESLYAESFVCQAARMDQLAAEIQRFLNSRRGNSLDAIKLNQFTVTQIDILKKLEHGGCR